MEPRGFINPSVGSAYDFGQPDKGGASVFMSADADVFVNPEVDAEYFLDGGGMLSQMAKTGRWKEKLIVGYVNQKNVVDFNEPLKHIFGKLSVEYKYQFKHPIRLKYTLYVIDELNASRTDIRNELKPSILLKIWPNFYPGFGMSLAQNNAGPGVYRELFSYYSAGPTVSFISMIGQRLFISGLFNYSSRNYYAINLESTDEPYGLVKNNVDAVQVMFFNLALTWEFSASLEMNLDYIFSHFYYEYLDNKSDNYLKHRFETGISWYL
jgi:hypothetical protein